MKMAFDLITVKTKNNQIKSDMIKESNYKFFLENMILVCVDLIVKDQNNKILLLKRKDEPLANTYCVPGGRVFKNEMIHEAVKRKVKEELGIDGKLKEIIDVFQVVFESGPLGMDEGTHIISFLVEVEWNKKQNITIDNDHANFIFSDKAEDEYHPYLKKIFESVKMQILRGG